MITNTMKVIKETHKRRINPRYDMCQQNISDIVNNTPDKYTAIMNSFVFGYAQGMKAARAEMKKQAWAVNV